MSRSYLYSVTDKALSDALNQSQISNNELRDLFLTRGVLINKLTERKKLAKNFSRYNHDYYDHQRIASSLGTKVRKEKTTLAFIPEGVDLSAIEDAAEKLKEKIISEKDLCHIIHKDNGVISIDITYESMCYDKSDFKQVVQKHASIELEKSGDHYVIRRPDNESVKKYEDDLILYINEEVEDEDDLIVKESISLLNIDSDKYRTDFFLSLIKSFSGYKISDVTDVYVFKANNSNDEFESESEDDLDDDMSRSSQGFITKISLKGKGVTSSDELLSLRNKNFYICKIRWKIKEDLADPDIYEFEAQFGNPENCEDFSFITKGAKRYKSNNEYFKKLDKLTDDEERKFQKIIEESALRIMREINQKAKGDINNDSSADKVEQGSY